MGREIRCLMDGEKEWSDGNEIEIWRFRIEDDWGNEKGMKGGGVEDKGSEG